MGWINKVFCLCDFFFKENVAITQYYSGAVSIWRISALLSRNRSLVVRKNPGRGSGRKEWGNSSYLVGWVLGSGALLPYM